MSLSRVFALCLLFLLVSAGWIWAFPEASIFFVGLVLAHVVLGVFLVVAAVRFRKSELMLALRKDAKLALLALCASALFGIVLGYVGATRPNLWIVQAHGAAGFLGAALLGGWAFRHEREFVPWVGGAWVLALCLPLYVSLQGRWFPTPQDRILNPIEAPESMEYEGAGLESPFFPAASRTNTGGHVPSDFFLDSKLCGECHKDVYEQWNESMHHFSSFNNQFYRKSIEYMQDTVGVEGSKWCAGCHDHAMLFSGMFDDPVKGQIDTPEAQAGLGCVSCHSISSVDGTMGNGGFTIEYPALHKLMASRNPVIRALDSYVINTAPAAHRQTFLKPFMREDRSEFCSACHKVHLDTPVNNYRWLRGFNEYDSWQASGVSGQGARSFYYPSQASDCSDCHMPLVESDDPGNIDGFVHSHRFPAANTAVPYVSGHEEQLRITQEFLRNSVTVDIFAASPADDIGELEMRRSSTDEPALATSFAVGEESASMGAAPVIREVGDIAAPLDRTSVQVSPGDTIRVDVVVRTRTVGHFFPGGTVDSFDVWLELSASDAAGKPFFWSGWIEEGGQGPVEDGAHFYRALLLDKHGNPIDKRNAFHARSALYVRQIPPGAADVAHFRIQVPDEIQGPIQLHAKLNYRKFTHFYTAFSYAGEPQEGGEGAFGKDFDDRAFTLNPDDIPDNVSGQIRGRIPNLPVTVIAQDRKVLDMGDGSPKWRPKVLKDDYERWNDYGIGLLLQGDLKGAEYAFQRVTEAHPEFADGWVNLARALIREGRTDDAAPYLDRALAIDDSLGRIHFFRAAAARAAGDYDTAVAALDRVLADYPRDRVVLNQYAVVLRLQRRYEEALEVLDRVARIDPEDLQMSYTRMLCYRGLGDEEAAARAEARFLRFKADESAQTITASHRRQSTEDNNERQSIHEHVSAPGAWSDRGAR
jgi:tetratricopeptide (TPR) repeat protein